MKITKEEADIIKEKYWTRDPEKESLAKYTANIVAEEVKKRGFIQFHVRTIHPILKKIAMENGLSYEHLASKITYSPEAWLKAIAQL